MPTYVRSGGSWVEIAPGSGRVIRVRHGGSWVDVVEAYARDASSWKLVYQASDPQTSTWYATASQAYRSTNAKRTDVGQTIYQGYYSSSYGEHRSVIAFNDANIRSVLSGRVIKKVTLRLSSTHFYLGDFNNPIGTIRMGMRSGSGIPASFTEDAGYLTGVGTSYNWPGGFSGARDQTRTITLPIAVGNAFRDNTYHGITVRAHSTDQYFYSYYHGADAASSLRPLLTIEHDVV